MHKRTIYFFFLFISLHTVLLAQTGTITDRYKLYLFQSEHPESIKKLMQSLDAGGQWPDIDYQNTDRGN